MINNEFGVQSVHNIIKAIKESFEQSDFVNTISYGTIFDIDLTKRTLYPLAHIQLDTANHKGSTIEFQITIINMDIVDVSKETSEDLIYGNDNKIYVLNNQLAVVRNAVLELKKRIRSFNWGYELVGEPTSEAFTDRFDNVVAGWTTTLTISALSNNKVC